MPNHRVIEPLTFPVREEGNNEVFMQQIIILQTNHETWIIPIGLGFPIAIPLRLTMRNATQLFLPFPRDLVRIFRILLRLICDKKCPFLRINNAEFHSQYIPFFPLTYTCDSHIDYLTPLREGVKKHLLYMDMSVNCRTPSPPFYGHVGQK